MTSHPSESYVYLPVAFYALLLSYALDRVARRVWPRRPQMLHALAMLALLGLAGAGTWVRNGRTLACGATAERILSGLPWDRLRQGDWTVLLGHRPGRPPGVRYGHYNFRGLDTIDDGDGSEYTMSAVLRLGAGNDHLKGEILQPDEFARRCSSPAPYRQLCWWVGDDGALEEYAGPGLGVPLLEPRSPRLP
jgi:hypothetical protein